MLMAAALVVLVILPALAFNGIKSQTVGNDVLTVAVFTGDTSAIDLDPLTDITDTLVDTDDAEDSNLNGILYASNDPLAYNQIYVRLVDPEVATDTVDVLIDADNGEEIEGPSGAGTLTLNESSTGGTFQGVFFILDDVDAGVDSIVADDGDVITVKYVGDTGTVSVKLVVDAKGPEITGTAPVHELIVDDEDVDFTATITDNGSGIRPDTEDADSITFGTSPAGSDDDGDGVTQEPVAAADGSSLDIQLNIGFDTATPTDDEASGDTNVSTLISGGWTEVSEDHSYSYTFEFLGVDAFKDGSSNDVYWNITATDRAGNTTVTDVDDEDDLDDNFIITIDNDDPEIDSAQTGIGFDLDDREEEVNRNAIKLVFTNENTASVGDPLATETIQPGDFVVENNVVTAIIHPDEEEDDIALDGTTEIDTRNIVYLILANELDPDEEPEVQMLGGALSDVAGNSNDNQSIDAADNIAPTLTVTITGGEVSGGIFVPNGVGGRMITDDEFQVRVESDEELDAAPKVYFVLIQFDAGDESKQQIESVTAGDSISSDGTNAWEEVYDSADVKAHGNNDAHGDLGGADQSLFAVIVIAEDASDQNNAAATDGWDVADGLVPADGEDVDVPDLDDAGLLAEMDDDIETVNDGTLIPNTGEVDVTESRNPFVRLRFTESDEFRIHNATGGDDQASLTDGDDKVDIDSHDVVSITSITLDGVDVSDQLLRAEDDEFSLALINLDEGEYELLYTAVDDLGNEIEVEFDFEVVERSEYELSLRPGWNLISLPGTPSDPSIDSVLPDSMKASTILSWRDGAFEVNERQSDGTWDPSGGVTEIVAGLGYWVLTTAFEDIETLIPERSPATILPTVAIVGGWNLIGVVDLAQGDAGDPLDGDADDYFSSIDQKVVYGFDTETTTFTKVKGTDKVVLGKGYWVWADEAGTLVP